MGQLQLQRHRQAQPPPLVARPLGASAAGLARQALQMLRLMLALGLTRCRDLARGQARESQEAADSSLGCVCMLVAMRGRQTAALALALVTQVPMLVVLMAAQGLPGARVVARSPVLPCLAPLVASALALALAWELLQAQVASAA